MSYNDKIFIGDSMKSAEERTKAFVNKAKNKHGDRYDYTSTKYADSHAKLAITCYVHGEFWQIPNNHLNGNGCPQCNRIKAAETRKSTTEEFVRDAKEVHGDAYNYSKVHYVSVRDKVIITCPQHGDFPQSPNSHLNGVGCPPCGDARRKGDTKRFIEKAILVHGKKYGYGKTDYQYSYLKVTITCSIHGDFDQQPNTHLNGAGCPSCKESKGEKRVRDVLLKHDIPFIREFKFPNSGLYEYDFYLPRHHLLIEFHGKQHFKAISFFGGEDRLRYTQKCDAVKVKLAEAFKIPLIEFTYQQLKLSDEEFETLVINTIKNVVHSK